MCSRKKNVSTIIYDYFEIYFICKKILFYGTMFIISLTFNCKKLLYILIWSIWYSNIVSIDDHQLPITLETLEQLIQKETDFDSDRYISLLLIQSQWPMIEDWHQKSQETFKRMSYIRSIGKDRSLWTQQVIKKCHGLF